MSARRLSSKFGSGDSIVQYTRGDWSQIDSGSSSAYAYLTHDANATVTFVFNGTLITVAGTLQPAQPAQPNASLSYVLDGADDRSFLPDTSSPTIIYASPELPQGPHTLAIRLLDGDTTLAVSGGTITGAQLDSGSMSMPVDHRRTIAVVAGTVGGLVVLTVILLALLLLFRRRQRRNSAAPYALGPLQATLPSTKEAFTSPKYSNHGLSFTHSTDSVNVLPRLNAGPYETPVKAKPKPKPNPKLKPSALS